jgi:predicted nucleic-acid-binding Zn-ribbon protein
MNTPQCPKCKTSMEKGYLFVLGGTASWKLNIWNEKFRKASPIKKFFKFFNNEIYITSYRCKDCGYLENYAK